MVLEIGADLNQGRYVDDDIAQRRIRALQGATLCEIVFLIATPLVEGNRISLPPGGSPDPLDPMVLRMQHHTLRPDLREELEQLKDAVIISLDGRALPQESLELVTAGLGGVAHEVGTLRMGGAGRGVVDSDLKVHDVDNLYVCDLSVFPSSPAANPSLTLVALALRLGVHLRQIDVGKHLGRG
jgi:choline dehydrogenase-like flavoprotein